MYFSSVAKVFSVFYYTRHGGIKKKMRGKDSSVKEIVSISLQI